jgi:hypothetical protein
MHLIETFYNISVQNTVFYPRKLTLPREDSFHLHGARGVGKSHLVIEYLQHLPEASWLYLDCQDPIFALEDIDSAHLGAFLCEEAIETLVLDHYYEGFLETFPSVNYLIVVTRLPMPALSLPSLELHGLDYEEFLSFGRDTSPVQSFNRFLKVGTLPAMAQRELTALDATLRPFFYASFDEDESRLILILARYSGHRITTHQLYTYAKEYFRISKDRVYRTVKRFEEEKLIFFIDDIEGKGARKMILYDYALARYLTKEQPFIVTFDTLIALALLKHGFAFTTLGNRGYLLGDELILPAPFETEETAWKNAYNRMSLYRKHTIRHIWVVTVSNRYRYELGGIVFEGIPFYEWSIVNE